jgi:mono/diheme cytochrome c family protein
MTLNPAAPSRALDITASGTQDARRLFSQVCSSCHGVDGNFIADHRLSDIASRLTLADIIDKIKNPVNPMPAMYPAVINEDTVNAMARFIIDGMH